MQGMDQIFAISEIHPSDRQLGAVKDRGDLLGLFDVQVGDDHLVNPRVVDQVLHGDAAHLACPAEYGNAHRGNSVCAKCPPIDES